MAKVVLVSSEEKLTLCDDPGPNGHGYNLRRIPEEMLKAIRESHTTTVESPGLPPHRETDEVAVQKVVLDYAIQSWWGIELTEDVPADCTAAAKSALPRSEKLRIMGSIAAINLKGESGSDLRPLPAPSAPPAPEVPQTPAA